MRVAFFGGSFDPIHRGHLAVASAAADRFALDTVLFGPTGRQPLKPTGASATFADRLAMTTLACAADPRFAASDCDAPRPDGRPNYTVDVLIELQTRLPGATIFNLVGIDSFLGVPRWREPERLMQLAEWIVVSRPGFSFADLPAPAPGSRIHHLDSIHEDVSATELRHRLLEGDPCADLIPASVAAYIRDHTLYR